MSVKLLLAEALDVVKQGEDLEIGCDHLAQAMTTGKKKKDFPKVRRAYCVTYDKMIRGLEMLNHCRFVVRASALGCKPDALEVTQRLADPKDAQLVAFIEERMGRAMDRCDRLREKEANLLVPADDADAAALDKEGHTVGRTYLDEARQLKESAPVHFEERLSGGAYQLIVKNKDDAVAAPVVTAKLIVEAHNDPDAPTPRHQSSRAQKLVPTKCAWVRYLGLAGPARVVVHVASDAWVRASNVEVTFRELIPPAPEPTAGVAVTTTPAANAAASAWAETLPPLPPIPEIPAEVAPNLGVLPSDFPAVPNAGLPQHADPAAGIQAVGGPQPGAPPPPPAGHPYPYYPYPYPPPPGMQAPAPGQPYPGPHPGPYPGHPGQPYPGQQGMPPPPPGWPYPPYPYPTADPAQSPPPHGSAQAPPCDAPVPTEPEATSRGLPEASRSLPQSHPAAAAPRKPSPAPVEIPVDTFLDRDAPIGERLALLSAVVSALPAAAPQGEAGGITLDERTVVDAVLTFPDPTEIMGEVDIDTLDIGAMDVDLGDLEGLM